MVKGDIILVPFPFTDLSGNKFRPALILCSDDEDVTVSFITSQLQWRDDNDIQLSPSIENGLKKESIIRLSKVATLRKSLVAGKLGNINSVNLSLVNKNLKIIFALD